jgi:hypothetical protein
MFPLPAPVPSYVIVQQWHERYTHDPANLWLRTLIAELFTSPAVSYQPSTLQASTLRANALRAGAGQHPRN